MFLGIGELGKLGKPCRDVACYVWKLGKKGGGTIQLDLSILVSCSAFKP